jgi:hypothetical protein
MRRLLAFSAFLCLVITTAAPVKAGGAVSLSNAYAFPTLSGTTNGAAFLTFKNMGDTPVKITGVASDVAETVELHNHKHGDDGVMSMIRMDTIDVPPFATMKFAPGGLHIMLIGIKEPLVKDAKFKVTLTLDDGRELPFDVTVKERK